MGGVLELGTADQVLEDTDMVIRIGTSFWEIQSPPVWSESSRYENEPREADMVFAEEGMISGEVEMECMSDGTLERIMEEMDELYGLCEEAAAARVPDADGTVVTFSSSAEPSRPSCFTAWKRSSDSSAAGESQKLLKKAVAGGACTNNGGGGPERAQESTGKGQHVMSERRRREKLNEMFLVLKSLLPSIQKADKVSILGETIAYLKELEQRVKELESSRAPTRPTAKKVSSGSKRKEAEAERDHHWVLSNSNDGGPSNVASSPAGMHDQSTWHLG